VIGVVKKKVQGISGKFCRLSWKSYGLPFPFILEGNRVIDSNETT
jgi:hypothetical protein